MATRQGNDGTNIELHSINVLFDLHPNHTHTQRERERGEVLGTCRSTNSIQSQNELTFNDI